MNVVAKFPNYSKEELRNTCLVLFGNIAHELNLFAPCIIQKSGDVHLIAQVHTGEYIHFRSWILHMRDCRQELAEGKIFIGGYIRPSFEETEKKSTEDGNDCIDYGKVFFEYGWFENNAQKLAECIRNAQPKYFPNYEKIRQVGKARVNNLL